MNKLSAALLVGAAMAVSTPAFGQATRTWVSGVGDDVNPCSRTAPCKTFAGAISKTAAGGEIDVLDPGGFGGVTITKSMTIDGLGPMASILAVGTNGININGAGIIVNIRNITINCAGSTIGNGIRIINAAMVNIDNVVFENCAGAALGVQGRGVAIETAADVRVTIQNSRFSNMTNFGVHSNPSAGTVTLTLHRNTFVRGGTTGVQLRQNTRATLNEVMIQAHAGAALALELATVTAHVSNSVFTDNVFGIFAGNGGAPVARVSDTVITRSTTAALSTSGGAQIISYGNNPIRGNTGNELPTSTELPR